MGLLITAAGAVALAVGFSLTAIASDWQRRRALLIFFLVTVGHFRVRSETGARVSVLVLGVLYHRSGLPDVRLHSLDRRAGIGGDTCADLAAPASAWISAGNDDVMRPARRRPKP
mgnify:CR=1 FL=1